MGEPHQVRQMVRARVAVRRQTCRDNESGWRGTLDPRDSAYVWRPDDRSRRGPYPKRPEATEIVKRKRGWIK